jgi:ketosteroid isomerase-like protein
MKRFSILLLIMCVMGEMGFAQERSREVSLASMVASERAFAKATGELGVRDGFLTFFAEDSILFAPAPTNAKESLSKRPLTPVYPPALLIEWEPVYGDVAESGDLGYLTGPSVYTDRSPQKRPTTYGCYFSVWQKQKDGTWKVVMDVGISTPQLVTALTTPFQVAPHKDAYKASGSVNVEAEQTALLSADREFANASKSEGAVKAYQSYVSADAMRLLRNGHLPFTNKDASVGFLSDKSVSMTWEPLKAVVARSADLGYTYGSYDLKSSEAEGGEKGYYMRVWKRTADGKWKVVMDVTSPTPGGR